MKYIKGVNMNFDDKAYLQSHFNEEEESGMVEQQIQTGQKVAEIDTDQQELPEEFRGVKPEMIEQNIKRLEMDMDAEILTIKMRYHDKIDHL